MSNETFLSMIVETPDDVSSHDVTRAYIEFIESMGWHTGGTSGKYDEDELDPCKYCGNRELHLQQK